MHTVSAQGTTTAPTTPTQSQLPTLPGIKGTSVSEVGSYFQGTFLPKLGITIIGIAVPLSVIFVIVGAIQFLTSYGNDEKVGNAKKTIYFALIGLAISLLAYAITQLLFYTAYYVSDVTTS